MTQDSEQNSQQQPWEEKPRFIDPNSGAAPQPGGYTHTVVAQGEDGEEVDPNEPVDNVTTPEEANEPPSGDEEGTQHVEEVSEEAFQGPTHENEVGSTDEGVDAQPGSTEEQSEPDAGNADPAPGEADPASTEDTSTEEGSTDEEYNPADHSVNEVLQYVEENPDQKDAVIAAEKDGKNRSTLLNELEG